MSKKIKIILVSVVLAVVLAAAAGIYFYVNRFDAAEYVKAVLDVTYKNESEAYMEMTGVSREEADAVFEESLDVTMEGFQSSPMAEELKPKYRELFAEIAKKVNYTVGEAEKTEDGDYAVPVKVKPITLFSDTYEEFQEKAKEYAKDVTDSVMAGEEMPSDEEMQSQVYQIYYDVLKESLDDGLLYGETVDATLHVSKNDEGDYEIDPQDLDDLDAMLIEDAKEE